jgi:aryl-alcohol dehydrogenase-like predicted oxidoreductase
MEEVKKSVQLEYRFLGNTGLLVSELCFGAMTLHTTGGANSWGMPTSDEETSFQLLDRFVQAGGNFIDTADIYDQSEKVLGKWLAKQGADKRKDFVIATKARGKVGPGPNDVGLSRKHIMDAVHKSLKDLQTDYIDLYQCHTWDAKTPLRETFSTLNDLVRSGKVRYIGISNFIGWQLQKAIDLTQQMGWEPIVSLQPQYNLLCREVEWELLPIAKNEGLAVLPWSPLKGGWLTGKYKRDSASTSTSTSTSTSGTGGGAEAGSRIEWAQKVGWQQTNYDSLNNDHTWRVIDQLTEVAKDAGKTPAQVALRWLLQKPEVTCPIIGARTVGQLEDNLGAAGWTLTETQMRALDAASAVPVPYPWGMHWVTSRPPPGKW